MYKRKILACLTTFVAILTAPAVAQESCDPDAFASPSVAVAAIEGRCCAKRTQRARHTCLGKQVTATRRLQNSLGSDFVNAVLSDLFLLQTFDCNRTTSVAEVCTESNSVSQDDVDGNVTESCCTKRNRSSRKRCLDSAARALRNGRRGLLDPDFIATARANVRTLRRSTECGRGGQKPKNNCNETRASSDGFGGWVHKPVSDSTGSIVNLLPSADPTPTSCRYENKRGRTVRDAFTSGRTNGNRSTWRPVGGGLCSTFPDNMVFNCLISGRRVCYNIPAPCVRND